jgi:hypothetical protein
MKTMLCIVPGLLCFFWVPAQTLYAGSNFPLGTSAYSTGFSNPFSFLCNTASLADCETGAALSASNRYMLKELAEYTAAATLPVAAGGIGLAMHYTGTAAAYSNMQWALAYGKALGRVQIGAGVTYNHTRIPGYVSNGAISYAIGTIWQLTPKFRSGLQLANFVGAKSNPSNTQPLSWSVGAGYEWSEKLLLWGVIAKESTMPAQVRVNMQYVVERSFVAGIGVMLDVASPWFSLGWQWENFRALITAAFHPQLGLTPGLMINVQAERDKHK